MDKYIAQRILDIQRLASEDTTYRCLLDEYHILDKQFQETLAALDDPQQAAIMDYLGVYNSMHLRLLELACSNETPLQQNKGAE